MIFKKLGNIFSGGMQEWQEVVLLQTTVSEPSPAHSAFAQIISTVYVLYLLTAFL